MRSKRLGNGWRLYLNERDFCLLLALADDPQAELALRLGGECGLRVSETIDVKPGDIRQSTHPGVDDYFLRIWSAKDTSGKREEGKYREAFLPTRTEMRMREYAFRANLAGDDPVFDVCKRTLQGWIKDVGHAVADHTGEEMWRKFSSHDLRAFFATNCLVRYNINPHVVKEVGGWADMKALKPYLDAPSDDIIAEAFTGAPREGYEPRLDVVEESVAAEVVAD